jgi:hypothetical protein
MKERRKTPRNRPSIDIGIYDKATGERVGRLVDISIEGIMLAGGRSMKTNTVYEFRITLPVSIYGKNEIVFNAVCLWCNEVELSSTYQAGFQLQEPSRELKELIDFWMKDPSF